MKPALFRSDVALAGFMAASVATGFAWRVAPWLLPASVAGLTLYFPFPLSLTLLQARERLREEVSRDLEARARPIFLSTVLPQARTWVVLWAAYFIALEVVAFFVIGGGNLVFSVPSGALVTGFMGVGLYRLPKASNAVWLAFSTLGMGAGVLVGAGALVFATMSALDLGGYSDIGLLVGPPVIGGATLTVGSIAYLLYAAKQDDGWYRALS